jgi:hypothetical protein
MQRMRTVSAVTVLVASIASTTGCRSFTANVPGVLDLRSDGSQAAPVTTEKVPVGETTREGFGSFLTGSGVALKGADVSVEDRHWWFIGLFSIINGSMQEEMTAALGKGALKNVKVGETIGGMDAGLYAGGIAASIFIPFLGWYIINPAVQALMPTMTGTFSGTKIATSGGAGEAMPPPTDPAPMTPEAAPPAPAPVTGGAP